MAAELIKGEKGACLTSRVRHVHKDNFLQEAYDIIQCDLVDCRSFEYNGTFYDVWFDDNFLLKYGPIYPTMILGDLKPDFFEVICGNFIITKCDEEGETIGITKEEANDLVTFMHKNLHKLYKAIKMGLLGERESA